MHRRTGSRGAFGAVLCAALLGSAGASDAAPATAPADCYAGMWKSNEELTKRTRPVMGPTVLFFSPWGKDGWVRLNITDLVSENSEYHFLKPDGRIYQVYGNDPREQMMTKVDDFTFETTSVRDGKPADKSIIVFSPDCRRITWTTPEGVRRDTGVRYFNDIRVFDKVEP